MSILHPFLQIPPEAKIPGLYQTLLRKEAKSTIDAIREQGTEIFDPNKHTGENIEKECPVLSTTILEYDADTGTTQYLLNEHLDGMEPNIAETYLASLSKVATVDAFLKNTKLKPEDKIIISDHEKNRLKREIVNRINIYNITDENSRLHKIVKELSKNDSDNQILIDDLLYLTLVPSTNETVPILTNATIAAFGGDEDKYRKHMKTKYGFEPSRNLGINQHFIDDAPNVGDVRLIAKVIAELKNEDPLFKYLSGEHFNFGFDIANHSHFSQVKNIIGVILEKTGYFPNVYWPKVFRGKTPAFMTFSSIFRIGSRTFIAFNKIKIPIQENVPEDFKYEGANISADFPNEDQQYAAYLKQVELFYGPQFRQKSASTIKNKLIS